jgi:hypothetical protein
MIHTMRLVLAHLLALLAAPLGATLGVLLLTKVAGRLTRWHSVPDDSGWMFSMPMGGLPWQIGSAVVRALGAFGAARLVYAALSVPPTLYIAAAVLLLLLGWDVFQLRLAVRPSLSPPPQVVSGFRRRIGTGFVASSVVAFLFIHG